MVTWLPAICALIVAIIFAIFITDPLFRYDKIVGSIMGLFVGAIVAVAFYSLSRGIMLIL